MTGKQQGQQAAASVDRWNEWTVGELRDALVIAIRKGFRRTFFISGQRGIGKSEIVHQAVAICGAYVVDRRLSMMDPSDIRGVMMAKPMAVRGTDGASAEAPGKGLKDAEKVINEAPADATISLYMSADQLATWLINPDFFPVHRMKPGQRLVIFLDEFNHAPDLIQKAAYEIAWDHSIGGLPFPDGTVVILAGNSEKENANVVSLDKPMRRRVIWCYIKWDYDSFWKYALPSGRFHPLVLGYLRETPLAANKPVDGEPEYFGEPLPASWEVTSDILRCYAGFPHIDKLVAGSLGVGMASEFLAWCETAGKLTPLIDAIENGEDKTADEASAEFFVTQSLVERFRNDPTKLARRLMDYALFIKPTYPEFGGLMIEGMYKVGMSEMRSCANFRKVMVEYSRFMA